MEFFPAQSQEPTGGRGPVWNTCISFTMSFLAIRHSSRGYWEEGERGERGVPRSVPTFFAVVSLLFTLWLFLLWGCFWHSDFILIVAAFCPFSKSTCSPLLSWVCSGNIQEPLLVVSSSPVLFLSTSQHLAQYLAPRWSSAEPVARYCMGSETQLREGWFCYGSCKSWLCPSQAFLGRGQRRGRGRRETNSFPAPPQAMGNTWDLEPETWIPETDLSLANCVNLGLFT